MMLYPIVCLCVCVVVWFAIYRAHARINPMFKLDSKTFAYRLAVFGLLAFVFTLATRCRPYADAQAAERPPCRDVALGAITGACVAKIKATPNVTEKNKLRAACLEEVLAWEQCR